MSSMRGFSGLNWVRGELNEELRLARDALEEYVEGGGESTVLGPCVVHIHKVQGVLQMLQLQGPSRLAEEMQMSAEMLRSEDLSNSGEAAEALMLSMIQLPDYLEKLEAGGADIPRVLLPAINDLRTTRGSEPLCETDLVISELAHAQDREAPADEEVARELRELAHRLRPTLHKSLISWFRSSDPADALAGLRGVFIELAQRAAGIPVLRGVFRTTHAVIEGLLEQSIPPDKKVKGLVGRVDRVIYSLEKSGVQGAVAELPRDVVTDLLGVLSRCDSENPVIAAVKSDYELERTMPSAETMEAANRRMHAPGADTLAGICNAAMKELLPIKDTLDLYMRGNRQQTDQLTEQAEPMRRLAATLEMAGMAPESALLRGRADDIRAIGEGRTEADDDLLMGVAGDLLVVESALQNRPGPGVSQEGDSPISRGEWAVLQGRTLEEATVEVAKVKEAIMGYMDNPANRAFLEAIPRHLHRVSGALRVISRDAPADILDQLGEYVQTRLQRRTEAAEPEVLDALADAVTGIEYYMEAVGESRLDADEILQIPRDAMERLARRSEVFAETSPETVEDSVEEITEVTVAPQTEEPMAVPAPSPEAAGMDPEILEIFLEEAREELEKIQTNFGHWRQHRDDHDALAAFRRSYHTLKGSGRLAGAMVIGEYAWSVENLLNRVIDQTLPVSDAVVAFLDEAIDALPELVDAQEQGREARVDVQGIVGRADELLAGPTAQEAEADSSRLAEPLSAPVAQPGVTLSVEDPELLEIFSAEAHEHLGVLREFLGRTDTDERPPMRDEVVRALHTLAGSARMADLEPIAVVAKALELKAGPLVESDQHPDAGFIVLLADGVGAIGTMVASLQTPGTVVPGTSGLLQRIDAYAPGSAQPLPEEEAMDAEEIVLDKLAGLDVLEGLEEQEGMRREPGEADTLDELPEADAISSEELLEFAGTDERPDQAGEDRASIDTGFQGESTPVPPEQGESALEELELTGIADLESDELEVLDLSPLELETPEQAPEVSLEGFDTGILEPGAEIPEISGAMEPEPIQAASADIAVPDGEAVSEQGLELPSPGEVSPGLEQAAAGETAPSVPAPEPAEPVAAELEPAPAPDAPVPAASGQDRPPDATVSPDLDPELREIFLEESQELLEQLDSDLGDWVRRPGGVDVPGRLHRTLHTLKGSARLAGIEPVGNLAHALESAIGIVAESGQPAQPLLLDLAQQALDALSGQVDAVREHLPLSHAGGLVAALEGYQVEAEAEEVAAEETGEEVEDLLGEEDVESISADPELLGIFLEEAHDLLDQLDERLREWELGVEDAASPQEVKRLLHTLKGSARLAGIASIGNLSHALETLLEEMTPEQLRNHASLLPLAQRATDKLMSLSDEVRKGGPVHRANALIAELEFVHAELQSGDVAAPAPQAPPAAEAEVPSAEEVEELPVIRRQPVSEQVRVRSDLLNRLVNNAGEISIYRARLEQQNTTLGFNLGELEQTVSRLHDQLRQMDIETEAQILYRYERERQDGRMEEVDFDPLELDRFSTIQQLSRSLMETVNDLSSIQGLLDEQQKEAETLLLQHARISNDLQDGLLRTRMVPFSQLVPRLHRLVRQTAASLGKRAMLEVFGAEGEMDRGILDRMLAPIEHILRNAISHGIEAPEVRRQAGKSETGKVSVYLSREGNDVVITVSDDGAGLNLAAIRKRAVEVGLIEEAALLDDDDIMQLVLEPGFSTVKQVTQISGRGVGTDVVVSEVKQLGGSLDIDSQPGRGTSFVIRLPFTLAISDALLIATGDEVYAVPHPNMEGLVRIDGDELARCYAGKQDRFRYAGHDYQVRYLGGLLGTGAPQMQEGRKWYPLLLVRTGEHRVAIQVDNVLGTRQIVVKSVGAQISTVRWISGGTILADGRVAMILDVAALVRMHMVHSAPVVGGPAAPESEDEAVKPVLVMVVDDSITVRKVTTRLLKRHNMEVVTAKDGVDAVAQMRDLRPDVMLLDIEMPRMDGYEVARHMRSSQELKDIPVIMITSRTGEKHRNLALSLGVSRYLGKPYQEGELLDNIYAVLAEAGGGE